MKRILILAILLMSSLAWAGSTTVVVGQGAGGGGGAPTPFVVELFEDMVDGEEWDADGNWHDVDTVPALVFTADTGVASIPQGSACGMIDTSDATHEPNLANGDRFIYRSFTALGNTGYANFEFYVRVTDANTYFELGLWDGSSIRGKLRFAGSGYVQWFDNTTETNVAAISNDTWTKIEIRVNLADSDGQENVWCAVGGGDLQGPYDTWAQSNPGSGIDAIRFNAWARRLAYVDAIRGYTGDRYTGSW